MQDLKAKIDATRIRDTQDLATAEAQSAKASERRRRDEARGENRALWIHHHARLAEEFARLSADHARRARELEEGGSRYGA